MKNIKIKIKSLLKLWSCKIISFITLLLVNKQDYISIEANKKNYEFYEKNFIKLYIHKNILFIFKYSMQENKNVYLKAFKQTYYF